MKRILIGMILLLAAGAAAGAQDRVKTMSLQNADGSYKADYTFEGSAMMRRRTGLPLRVVTVSGASIHASRRAR